MISAVGLLQAVRKQNGGWRILMSDRLDVGTNAFEGEGDYKLDYDADVGSARRGDECVRGPSSRSPFVSVIRHLSSSHIEKDTG